jgi:hypothetical protein
LPLGQGLPEYAGWIWEEGDRHEAQQIDVKQASIDLLEVREQGMVVDPHDADDGEADNVCSQRRPLPCELVGQIPLGAGLGDLRTSNVIAIANTASLNASTRVLLTPQNHLEASGQHSGVGTNASRIARKKNAAEACGRFLIRYIQM